MNLEAVEAFEAVEAVEAVEAFRNHHMSSGTPPRDRSRPPRNREALEKLEDPRDPRPAAVRCTLHDRATRR